MSTLLKREAPKKTSSVLKTIPRFPRDFLIQYKPPKLQPRNNAFGHKIGCAFLGTSHLPSFVDCTFSLEKGGPLFGR